jgi:hypothetical protein|tara:strand:+ start:235 stop:486 length:252 start_codon:yes stop_codon:yes gene_type:complete
MKIKPSGNRSNPAPPYAFYPNKASMRGKMANTHDGKAVLVFTAVSVFIILYSILSVINNTETEDESGNTKTNQIKERIFKLFK